MNWQYLRYFEVVAREEHYTRAAEMLHLTQSALSKSIHNLENRLGVPLFEPDGRNIKLTKYGQIFYNHVIVRLRRLKGVSISSHDMVGAEQGEVTFRYDIYDWCFFHAEDH